MADTNFDNEWESLVTFVFNPLTNMLDEGINAESRRPFTVEQHAGFVSQIHDMLNASAENDGGFVSPHADLHNKVLNYLVSFFNI